MDSIIVYLMYTLTSCAKSQSYGWSAKSMSHCNPHLSQDLHHIRENVKTVCLICGCKKWRYMTDRLFWEFGMDSKNNSNIPKNTTRKYETPPVYHKIDRRVQFRNKNIVFDHQAKWNYNRTSLSDVVVYVVLLLKICAYYYYTNTHIV